MTKELIFNVKKQEDGTYLASCRHGNGIILAEGRNYKSLLDEVAETVGGYISEGYDKQFGWAEDLKILLVYSELLFKNPEAEKILITGIPENGGYRVRANTLLSLDLYHSDFDSLREQLLQEIQKQGHHNKHIEFRLEKIL